MENGRRRFNPQTKNPATGRGLMSNGRRRFNPQTKNPATGRGLMSDNKIPNNIRRLLH